MNESTCYVISAAQWSEVINLVVLLPLLCILAIWLFPRDWHHVEHVVRRFFRRRRLRVIRARRVGGAA